jgi:hypothetical protein
VCHAPCHGGTVGREVVPKMRHVCEDTEISGFSEFSAGFSCPFCRAVVQSHCRKAFTRAGGGGGGNVGTMPSATASVWPLVNGGQGLQQAKILESCEISKK